MSHPRDASVRETMKISCSALSLSSKEFSLNAITKSFLTSSTPLQSGTVMPSSVYTPSPLLKISNRSPNASDLIRKFKKTVCKRYVTKELPREINARGRRTARLAAQVKAPQARRATSARERNVEFNTSTYKMYALPDYPL
ncbi:hypothetical protein QCA50_018039 [Cerrena zonata]|uniref:Uncharacterized protein n=1 Tax=Cerrena zonata TaxID=2478898 RepID=A0AAW0FH95_9APHY